MRHYLGFSLWALAALFLAGCETIPSARIHYTLKQDPSSRPLQQVVLMPVEVDVYEMSAGGVKEEVPAWSNTAETNVRNALLISKAGGDQCCATRPVDTSVLTPEQRQILEEHLALFDRVAANALWLTLPQNTAWHFKNDHFDYTLGNGLSFLKTEYDVDGGLIVLGEDVVSSAGRKITALVGAAFGVVVPMGHSFLNVGLVDFASGDLLWMNHEIAAGNVDLRDSQSCLKLVDRLMEGYPGLQSHGGSIQPAGD
jgi:hypothetical protein